VAQGTYEVHLFFAETSGLLANSRHVWINLNGTSAVSNFDVVDDTEGGNTATAQVLTDVKPENDGKIHLDTTTTDSFLNAIEILPSAPHHILPVRITTGPLPYQGSNGDQWIPDHYFSGGRVSHSTVDLSRFSDGQLYEWHRYGHFHYSVPVTAGGMYTLKLHFLEGWFGGPGGAIGGVGSRVFDVSCNGNMLLKKFDIFKEAGSDPLVKAFSHIEPTGQGRIEIYFTPRTNYPALSAIEIIPE